MNKEIGLQLYTLRAETKKDFIGTLKKVAEMGYKGVEFSGFGGIEAAEMRKALDQLGLVSIGSHTKFPALKKELSQVFAYNREIGSKYIICPSAECHSIQEYRDTAKLLSEIGKKCDAEGFTFCYHNHIHELEQYEGEYGLDILYREADEQYVKAEIDVCFLQAVGIDPAAYVRKYTGRCPLLHLKDLKKGEIKGTTEVGNGILDMKEIIKASKESGVEWLIVEQQLFVGSCLESAKLSIENTRKLMEEIA